MLLRQFEYLRPESVEDAIGLLGDQPGARPLAGGATLINFMKMRFASPSRLVDVSRLGELRGIELSGDGALELGAGVTFAELAKSGAVREARPIIAHVAATLADVQVRNRATIGGNLCHNDLNNNLPPLAAALGAEMTIRGVDGERTVAAADFFKGVFTTAVGPGELLVRVHVPARLAGQRDGWAALRVGADGPGLVNVAATLSDGGARLGLGGVAPVPVVVDSAVDEPAAVAAVRAADLNPPADVHATSEYRRHLAAVLAARAVRHASQDGGVGDA